MLSERDIVAKVHHLTVMRLRVWVKQGWIKPADEAAQVFSEADAARAALICNLEDQLGFAEEDVPVLLSLIDQIHGTPRRADGRTLRARGFAAGGALLGAHDDRTPARGRGALTMADRFMRKQ